jgi:hypothetical protein
VKRGGPDRAHAVFWGGQGYGSLSTIAPWHNVHDVMAVGDDYSHSFGRHLLKVGGLVTRGRKDEDIGGASAFEAPQFGAPPASRAGKAAPPATCSPTCCSRT